ncbi:hypothetical protein L1987_35450 [Smallanthus sonchifolius]|uniref:Uncharacterized protein n=1 Tax=Smallanthus sonchifolius TaxID=185202 RepID=A0ACB9HY30_9ASTR|nr:hypothetical protein L1987_35450 [Smallanthus sonchifolius]
MNPRGCKQPNLYRRCKKVQSKKLKRVRYVQKRVGQRCTTWIVKRFKLKVGILTDGHSSGCSMAKGKAVSDTKQLGLQKTDILFNVSRQECTRNLVSGKAVSLQKWSVLALLYVVQWHLVEA